MQVRKKDIFAAITFDELLAYGHRACERGQSGASAVDGVPWSFSYHGHPVTHENNDCYIIGASRFERGQILLSTVTVGAAWVEVLSAEEFHRHYEPAHLIGASGLPPRVTCDPVRSIDFRITDTACPQGERFTPQVIAALRAIADELEQNDASPWRPQGQPLSGFSALAGDRVVEVQAGGFGTSAAHPVRIQWAAATQLDRGEITPAELIDGNALVAEPAPEPVPAEVLADLTVEELLALGHIWRLSRTAHGWTADNGEHRVFVWTDEADMDYDELGRIVTETLRKSRIITESQQISIIVENQA